MLAGLAPTPAKAGFVGAALEAGCRAELAGGGRTNAAAPRAKVAEIQSKSRAASSHRCVWMVHHATLRGWSFEGSWIDLNAVPPGLAAASPHTQAAGAS